MSETVGYARLRHLRGIAPQCCWRWRIIKEAVDARRPKPGDRRILFKTTLIELFLALVLARVDRPTPSGKGPGARAQVL